MRGLLVLVAMTVTVAGSAHADMTFVHPGALNTAANLDFIKAQIEVGEQPAASEFRRIRESTAATRSPNAVAEINSVNGSTYLARDDAIAAYTQALLWRFTDDAVYADRAVAILNAWSDLNGFTHGTDQDKLRAGWIGAVLAQAAEIMRSYDVWSAADIATLQAMFRRAYYPQLIDASSWNGNVDLTQIDALISIAVFNEDEAMFDLSLKRLQRRNPAYFYLQSDGKRPQSIDGDGGNLEHFWFNPVAWVDGLNQETCRDNGHHSQFALGSALHVAEVAWNQGVDVYTPNKARYTAAIELLASQLLSGNFDTCKNTAATNNRFNTWEIAYHHYHNREGVDLPYTRMLIEQQVRTGRKRATWNLVYETLTHANLPSEK